MKTLPRHSRSFTLVELLVVMAIIAVMAALLLPALRSAKDRAKAAQCTSNQRQISGGWTAYLGDHNGYYPYKYQIVCGTTNVWDAGSGQPWCAMGGYSGLLNRYWYPVFAPYIGGSGRDKNGHGPWTATFYKIMRCPANPWPTSNFGDTNEFYGGWWITQGAPVNPCSYSLNNEPLPGCHATSPFGSGAWPKYNSPIGWQRRANMNDIQHPSGTAMLLENPLAPVKGAYADTPWRFFDAFAGWTGLPLGYGGGGWYGGSDAFMVTNYSGLVDHGEFRWLRSDCNGSVSAFHNLGMNVLFFDGHAARITKAQLFAYAGEAQLGGSNPNSTPGGIFWTDGFGVNSRRYENQYPTYAIDDMDYTIIPW